MRENYNGFRDYLIQIGKYPLLTETEELELGRRIKEDNDKSAREQLINSNLRLVVHIAKSYKDVSSISIEDLVSDGNLGLITAVDKYDYKMGYRFSTCAIPWIKQAITKSLTDKSRAIRLPAHIYQQITQMNKIIAASSGDLTDGKIAELMGTTPQKVAQLKQYKQTIISLETPLNDEEKNTVADLIADPTSNSQAYANEQEQKELVREMIASLPERTQIIMKMRYGLGSLNDPEDWQDEHTLEEIGAKVGLTRERVRQIEKQTLQELKNKFNY